MKESVTLAFLGDVMLGRGVNEEIPHRILASFSALYICGMNLVFLWDGHLARPLYYRAGRMPTPQQSSLDSLIPEPSQ
jgi:hypothetical protein